MTIEDIYTEAEQNNIVKHNRSNPLYLYLLLKVIESKIQLAVMGSVLIQIPDELLTYKQETIRVIQEYGWEIKIDRGINLGNMDMQNDYAHIKLTEKILDLCINT